MGNARNIERERFARIDALMEEFRTKHEDFEALLDRVTERAERARTDAMEALRRTRKKAVR